MSLVSKTSSLSAHLLVAAAFTMPSGSVAAKDIVLGASVQLNNEPAATLSRTDKPGISMASARYDCG